MHVLPFTVVFSLAVYILGRRKRSERIFTRLAFTTLGNLVLFNFRIHRMEMTLPALGYRLLVPPEGMTLFPAYKRALELTHRYRIDEEEQGGRF